MDYNNIFIRTQKTKKKWNNLRDLVQTATTLWQHIKKKVK